MHLLHEVITILHEIIIFQRESVRMQAFLDALGIMSPTEVQAAAIPRVLQGGNVAIQCYTGSGKVCPTS